MAGNSRRRGAIRNPGSKKPAVAGSGGQRRKALQGKGPTPKASERTGHPAARRSERRAGSGGRDSRPPARREKPGIEVVAGRNPVLEALRAGVPAVALYLQTRIDSDDRVRESLKLAADRGIPLLECTRGEADRLSGGAVHQGVLLQVAGYEYTDVDGLLAAASATGTAPLLIALDGVTDPRNLGAIVRSVAAFGGHGVLVPQRRSAGMTAGAWKASAGAAARVPVARATNLTRALERLQAAGCLVVGLDAGGDAGLTGLAGPGEAVVLVVGSEGKGLSRLVRQTCDVLASIPIAAGTESLNAGVAAGIALYEVTRPT